VIFAATFVCTACDHETNADINGAINILRRAPLGSACGGFA
jgi:transposase